MYGYHSQHQRPTTTASRASTTPPLTPKQHSSNERNWTALERTTATRLSGVKAKDAEHRVTMKTVVIPPTKTRNHLECRRNRDCSATKSCGLNSRSRPTCCCVDVSSAKSFHMCIIKAFGTMVKDVKADSSTMDTTDLLSSSFESPLQQGRDTATIPRRIPASNAHPPVECTVQQSQR